MQSESEPCVWYSCYETIRNAVMGCCYSICHKENDSQVRSSQLQSLINLIIADRANHFNTAGLVLLCQ